jgi:hypothetical protein
VNEPGESKKANSKLKKPSLSFLRESPPSDIVDDVATDVPKLGAVLPDRIENDRPGTVCERNQRSMSPSSRGESERTKETYRRSR